MIVAHCYYCGTPIGQRERYVNVQSCNDAFPCFSRIACGTCWDGMEARRAVAMAEVRDSHRLISDAAVREYSEKVFE
jgi:hypothetical protein